MPLSGNSILKHLFVKDTGGIERRVSIFHVFSLFLLCQEHLAQSPTEEIRQEQCQTEQIYCQVWQQKKY